jgi:hypothetical protein
MINVEKLALFCNPASGGTLQAFLIALYRKIKIYIAVAKAKVFPHLEAWVRMGRGIPHAKDFVSSLSALIYTI